MIILRILLGIIAIPFLLLAYILKYFFYLLTLIGSKLVLIIGGLIAMAGIVWLAIPLIAWDMEMLGQNLWSGIGLILGGGVVCLIPWIGVFLSNLFGSIANWIRVKVYLS